MEPHDFDEDLPFQVRTPQNPVNLWELDRVQVSGLSPFRDDPEYQENPNSEVEIGKFSYDICYSLILKNV